MSQPDHYSENLLRCIEERVAFRERAERAEADLVIANTSWSLRLETLKRSLNEARAASTLSGIAQREANIAHDERDRAWAEARSSCPCQYVELIEPCGPHCSCANPVMSGGCSRCCRYGSKKQRMVMAQAIVAREAEAAAMREALVGCLRFMDPLGVCDNVDVRAARAALSGTTGAAMPPSADAIANLFAANPGALPKPRHEEGPMAGSPERG